MLTPTISTAREGVIKYSMLGSEWFKCADCGSTFSTDLACHGHRLGAHPDKTHPGPIELRGRLGNSPAQREANKVRKQLGAEINRLVREINTLTARIDEMARQMGQASA